jgi:hypothetical protein
LLAPLLKQHSMSLQEFQITWERKQCQHGDFLRMPRQ